MPESVTKAPEHRPLDDETAAALTLYNTYLVADREQQAHERALKKADRVKDEAAKVVRRLNEQKAPTAETAAAEAKYRESVEALRRLRDGDTAISEGADDPDDEDGSDTVAAADGERAASEEPGDAEIAPAAEAPDPGGATQPPADEASEDDTATQPPADEASEDDTAAEEPADEAEEKAEETSSVGVEAPVGDDDLAGDELAGVAGEK